MRISARVREAVQAFWQGRTRRLDTKFFQQFVPKKFPNLAQLSHIGTFLSEREKNIVAVSSLVALISFGGILNSLMGRITTPVPANGGMFNIALVDQPTNINPLFAATETDRALTRLLFLPLCNFTNFPTATVAETCDVNAQKTRATISLADRTWHNGKKITADDVVFTLNTLADEKVGSPWYELARRVSAQKISDTQVVVTATRPLPALKTLLSLGVISVQVWKNIAATDMKSQELNLKPTGSGPFEYQSITNDSAGGVQTITLSAFKDFAPRRPYLDAVSVRFSPDEQTAQDLFRARQIDDLTLLGSGGREDLIKRDVKRHEIITPIVIGLFFNPLHFKEAGNADVRRAFALGIDRAALIKNVFKNEGAPLRAAFPSTVLHEPQILEPEFDAEKARPLFEKLLNTKPEITLSLGIPSDPLYTNIANEIANQLSACHIKLTPIVVDPINAPAATNQVDLMLIGQNYGSDSDPLPFWHSTASAVGGANYARYQIKSVDQLLEQLRSEPADANREKILQKINTQIVSDLPAVFLVQPALQSYIAQKFSGVNMPAVGAPETVFSSIENWYTVTSRSWKWFDK